MKPFHIKNTAFLLLLAFLGTSFTSPKQDTEHTSGDSYVVVAGGVKVNTYNGQISHLVISNVVYLDANELEPAKKYFNELVFHDFPAYRNSFSSGYGSYYKIFTNKYEALSFRKRLIENTLQVNVYFI